MEVLERSVKESARDYAVRTIRKNIISLDLRPGAMVSENEISAQLGMSRTPIREALIELSKVGIVDILPQKGSRIAYINFDLVTEARFMRLVLERAVIDRLCNQGLTKEQEEALAENIALQEFHLKKNLDNRLFLLDESYHFMMFQFAQLELTYQLSKNFNVHFDRVRNITASGDPIHDGRIIEDHQQIFEAILDGDNEKGVATLNQHLNRCNISDVYIQDNFGEYVKQE